MPQGANSLFFTLIPKVSNPIFIKDFRPISLIDIHYKIIAKILANRLSKVIDTIEEEKMLIFKVDFDRAFDSVSWKHLDFVLHGLGFGNKWRSWIRACLHSSRASSRLSSWKASLLYIGGRLTLIKSVLGSLGICYLLIFKAPEIILKSLERLRVKVFWGGQDSKKLIWIKWAYVLSSFEKKGLNIGSLKSFNLTLLQKWRWRWFSFPNALWVKVIKATHGQEGGFDTYGCKFNGIWARIVSSSNFLHLNNIISLNSFHFKAGCCTRIRFWKDIWIGGSPLNIRYNRHYRLELNKDSLIIDRIENEQWSWSWNWSRNDLGVHNTTYFRLLLIEISRVDVSTVGDTCIWSLAKDYIFSVKEARRVIDDKILPSLATVTSWDKIIPRKVNILCGCLSWYSLKNNNNDGRILKSHEKLWSLKASIKQRHVNINNLDRNPKHDAMSDVKLIEKRMVMVHDSKVVFPLLVHSSRLCPLDREYLETHVSLDEIKSAIWDCVSNKSPSPDGFTFAFVKKYWDLVKMDILEFVNSFFYSCLHCALSTAVSSNLIHGINLGSFDLTLSHLFYADDVIITTEWNPGDLDNIVCVLHIFYLASRLKININKSNIYGIGVSNDEVYNMARNFGCAAGSFSFTYLGLPIGSTMNHISNWKTLIDWFQSRLSSWKASLLSIGGRLTLIKAVLGLNIGSLKSFNLTLLQKWRWRWFSFPNALWVKVIKATHGQEGGFDTYGRKFNGIWARIVSSSNFLHLNNIIPLNSFRFKAGYCTRIRFWKDIWIGGSPLNIRYNRHYRL
nr:RNA-directed DNA polymerase, eukaryota, reverse transcriptase zinc-binding domain protein [Tanacetum cinerariifolium]